MGIGSTFRTSWRAAIWSPSRRPTAPRNPSLYWRPREVRSPGGRPAHPTMEESGSWSKRPSPSASRAAHGS
eukprot:2525896-Pyramimonas_sp.AAC.1